MKVLMINGSPHPKGNTSVALNEMIKVFEENGVEVKYYLVGNKAIRSCIACNSCYKLDRCVFDDEVNEIAKEFEDADALVVGTPVYYAGPNATLTALLTRLFYSTGFDKTMKVGAAVVTARRSGTTATFDALNKYFTISGMPVASSYYWNNYYGKASDPDNQDIEGRRVMRQLARHIVFLMRGIELAKEEYGMPVYEQGEMTNFMR
ncbi:MAG: flavodoxin family protein [Erysipelotrichaceae bacterium]|nr:flavodoxin family protein [Erysipelotrichaceae bacterium]